MRFRSLWFLLVACAGTKAIAANHNEPEPVLPPVHEAVREIETHFPWKNHHRSLSTTNTTLAEPLIVSGETPAVGEFPWIVKTASIYTTCTASLIHSDVVLTAAHCQGAWVDGVYVGAYQFDNKDSRSQFRRVERQYRHPQYDFDRKFIAADLMLLFLESPVDGITPVHVNSDPDLPTKAAAVQVLGFGNTAQDGPRPNRLQTARLDYVSPDVCEFWMSFFRNVDYDYSILCAGAPDGPQSTCNGDSGGPLILATDETNSSDANQPHVQIGVTSFGKDCESFPTPNGFTRLSSYADWIRDQICEHSAEPPEDCPPIEPSHPIAVQVNITLQQDGNPFQTTWSIRDQRTRQIVFVGPVSVPVEFSIWSTTMWLIPGDYTLELHDSAGDGLVSPYIFGTFIGWAEIHLEIDGKWVQVGDRIVGDFEFESETDFLVPGDRSDPPSPAPSDSPSQFPSQAPSLRPTSRPSGTPSQVPSLEPSQSPSLYPSQLPSSAPSASPSVSPSAAPSASPSSSPSLVPSTTPSLPPTDIPSGAPSSNPSSAPSVVPTESPAPSSVPSDVPSILPSAMPSNVTELGERSGSSLDSSNTREEHVLAATLLTALAWMVVPLAL